LNYRLSYALPNLIHRTCLSCAAVPHPHLSYAAVPHPHLSYAAVPHPHLSYATPHMNYAAS
jgi:hypothetical protein